LDDVPVIQAILREEELRVVVLEGNGFDVGNPEGYWAANLYIESKQPQRPRW
jgi:UTP-glucose-1-phosphate uridylyltransferase